MKLLDNRRPDFPEVPFVRDSAPLIFRSTVRQPMDPQYKLLGFYKTVLHRMQTQFVVWGPASRRGARCWSEVPWE